MTAMLSYVYVGTNDLARAIRFYEAVLGALSMTGCIHLNLLSGRIFSRIASISFVRRSMRSGAALILLLPAASAVAQEAVLSNSENESFSEAREGNVVEFPKDHGAHPDFRTEWWYLTANLIGPDNIEYGIQWTLFRSALAPHEAEGWSSPQIWMGHAALTSATQHHFGERLGRGGIGQAGVTLSPFSAWIDNWEMVSRAPASADSLSSITLKAADIKFQYDLKLEATGPLIEHGTRGYMVKSSKGQAGYYYSQPYYRVSGTLTLPEGKIAVIGQAWLDHEWFSTTLTEDQTGWDWLSLHFDSGEKLMVYRVRDGGAGVMAGTWVGTDQKPVPVGIGALTITPVETTIVANREIPTSWRVELPSKGVDIETLPLNPQAWMNTTVSYWEGPVRFEGTHKGRGYLEMTGYE